MDVAQSKVWRTNDKLVPVRNMPYVEMIEEDFPKPPLVLRILFTFSVLATGLHLVSESYEEKLTDSI